MHDDKSMTAPSERTLKLLMIAKRIQDILRFSVENLSAVIAFMALNHFFGLKTAIAGTILFTILDAIRRKLFHLSFPVIYLVSSGLTIGFGVIDLFSVNPFMLRFEAVISNIITGGTFVAGAGVYGKKSMIQEIAEQKQGTPFVNRPDLHRFFSYITLLWASYFFIRAMIYLWLGLIMPLERAVEIRAMFGTASLLVMIVITSTQSRRLYGVCQRFGWLPARPEETGQ